MFVACTSRMGREAECINVSKVMVGISFTSDGKMEEKDLICIQPYFYSQNWGGTGGSTSVCGTCFV